ncbi:MAG: hypothetical protein FWH48_11795, partial [Oscillospiraceae bacterium]|nr:hypothetical protein [Oscillospiraceae bacterium]
MGKTDKLTFRQHIKITLRGLKILASVPQTVMILKIFQSIFDAAVPLINIYFSARILNELAGEKNQGELVFLVLLAIGLNLASMLAKSIFARYADYRGTDLLNALLKVYADKLFFMDCMNIEDSKIQQQFSEIRKYHFGTKFSLYHFLNIYSEIVFSIMPIVLSVAMAFSLFSQKVPAGSQFAYLDSLAFYAIVIIVFACTVFLSPYLSMIGGRTWTNAAKEDNKRKRLFYFNCFDITGIERAKDIRIYKQKHIIDKSAADFFDYQFAVWEKCAKFDAKFKFLSAAVSYLAYGLIYLYVAAKAFAGAFGVGGIVQYVGAITLFGRAVAAFFTNIGELANSNAFMEKIIEFLDIPE